MNAIKAKTVNISVPAKRPPFIAGELSSGILAPKPPECVKVSPPVDTEF